MTEKSGIEILEEILSRLELLEKKVDIIDRNTKLLLNDTKAVGSTTQVKQATAEIKTEIQKVARAGFKNFKFERSGASTDLNELPKQPTKHVVVKGKMVAELDGKVVPLSSISVKIYNDSDMLVKETRTNRAGHWVSHLSPGKYVALFEGELNGKKLVSQNRNFVVPENQLEFEVS